MDPKANHRCPIRRSEERETAVCRGVAHPCAFVAVNESRRPYRRVCKAVTAANQANELASVALQAGRSACVCPNLARDEQPVAASPRSERALGFKAKAEPLGLNGTTCGSRLSGKKQASPLSHC